MQVLDEQGTFKAANFARLRETFGLADDGEEEVVVAVDSRRGALPSSASNVMITIPMPADLGLEQNSATASYHEPSSLTIHVLQPDACNSK